MHDQNDDKRFKQKCITILKTAQKQLTELENKSLELTRTYLINKRKLEKFSITKTESMAIRLFHKSSL